MSEMDGMWRFSWGCLQQWLVLEITPISVQQEDVSQRKFVCERMKLWVPESESLHAVCVLAPCRPCTSSEAEAEDVHQYQFLFLSSLAVQNRVCFPSALGLESWPLFLPLHTVLRLLPISVF